MISLFENIENLFTTKKQYDKITLLQTDNSIRTIFVNLDTTGKRPTKVFPKNYFTQETFKSTFGVDFEEVIINYFKIYAEKNKLDVCYDDNLISLIQLMKFLIRNRDKDVEEFKLNEEFIKFCDTPHTKHFKENSINPFLALDVGPGFQTLKEPSYTYININNFIFTRRNKEYKIYFRY